MTEENLLSADSSPVLASEPMQAETPAPAPRLYRDEEVNGIVKKKEVAAYEKGKREAMSEWQRQQPQQQPSQPAPAQYQQQQNYQEQDFRQQLDRALQEREESLRQQQVDAEAKRIVDTYAQKLLTGAQDKPDFWEKVQPLNLGRNENLIALTHNLDNPTDVLMHLAENLHKLGSINGLLMNPATQQSAFAEIQALSDSIKNNKNAVSGYQRAPEPLSQIRPSNVGEHAGGDSSSIASLRRQSWLRG